jgi:hypothetical protein
MKAIHAERLLKLADHLENGKMGHKEFDFAKYNRGPLDDNGCGTAGCAMGECPFVFPDDFTFALPHGDVTLKTHLFSSSTLLSGMIFFDIRNDEYSYLFNPRGKHDVLGNNNLTQLSTKEEVAQNIRDFVAYKQKGGQIDS